MATDEQNGEMRVDYWMALFCRLPDSDMEDVLGDPADFGIGDESFPDLLTRRWRAALFRTREELDAAIEKTHRARKERCEIWHWRWTFMPIQCRIVEKGGE